MKEMTLVICQPCEDQEAKAIAAARAGGRCSQMWNCLKVYCNKNFRNG